MVVKERILNPWVCSWGYKKVTLHKDGKPHEKFVHRLSAEAFIPPYCGEQVNHIDGDKRNNRLDNLEWCTGTENMRHAYKHGLHPKVVAVKCAETGDVFSSVSEAARAVNGKTSSVWRCINGKRKTHRGYHFVLAEEVEDDTT